MFVHVWEHDQRCGLHSSEASAHEVRGITQQQHLLLTPLLFFLPKATLAATIVVAVLSLVDFSVLKNAWSYSKVDFAAVFATIVLTLGFGVEAGVSVVKGERT